MNLEANIERMKKELAAMEEKLADQDKMKLKGGYGYVLQASQEPLSGDTSVFKGYITRGAFRPTHELAKISDENMVKRNRLEAYVIQFQGNLDGDYTINYANGLYIIHSSRETKNIGAVFMEVNTARKICELLNSGKITL